MTPCEKLGYKVGDEFEVVMPHKYFTIEPIVTLSRDDGSDCPLFKRGGDRFYMYLCKCIKVIDNSTKETVMTKSNKYQFHSLSESDIDWNRIAQDLSSKNPLAFVDAGNGEQYVVVYDLFASKAFECDIEMIEIDVYEHHCDCFEVYKLTTSTFSDWVNWAKKVKQAMWPIGRKAVVTVSLPKV